MFWQVQMTCRSHKNTHTRRRITETQLNEPTFESLSKNGNNHTGNMCYQNLIFLLAF